MVAAPGSEPGDFDVVRVRLPLSALERAVRQQVHLT